MAASTHQERFELIPHRRPGAEPLSKLRRFAVRNPLGAGAAFAILVLAVIAITAPLLTPFDPYTLDAAVPFHAPSATHWFGTDDLGRDVFTRVLFGARISLWVGFLAVSISIGIGVPVGIISAFAGGWVDYVLQRIVDALFAFPTIVLGLAIVSVLGTGVTKVIIAVGIVSIPRVARVVRSSTLGVMGQPYVEAATAVGAQSPRIIARHILPNVFAPVLILATAGFGAAILAEAALSFLGVGTPPPEPSWGIMLSGAAQQYVRTAPWMAIFPGIAISIAVFAFNLFGDALRDELDPRLRGSR
jgi:peptide/nickel transport system permease protein